MLCEPLVLSCIFICASPFCSPRVQYWEPAKFAQRLRAIAQPRKQESHLEPVLLKVDMTSGHFSASDRYANLKEEAFTFAWAMRALGLK